MGNATTSGFDTSAGPCGTDPYNYETFDDDELPRGLYFSFKFLTEPQREFCRKLCWMGQEHLFAGWTGTNSPTPEAKRRMVEQLQKLDKDYPRAGGGLEGYLKNARKLLNRSRHGLHPLTDWVPSVPTTTTLDDDDDDDDDDNAVGHYFEFASQKYQECEKIGLTQLGRVGFVLVAGGGSLGSERLGYSNIKLSLPTEMTTETCFLQHYIEYILAFQEKYAAQENCLPLCIMTSSDTNNRTVDLLEKNDYFGMDKGQVTIVQQGMGVPALMDNQARIALHPKDQAKILTKPHGHGDVHCLLYSSGVAEGWKEYGIEWVYMFQDTNALAFQALPLMLGVSWQHNLMMNSLAVPRKAGQAIGGITKLTNSKTGETRTMNVEYNQLDALLRDNGFPNGDVNDPKTGFSPFPGNVNQLLFKLDEYYDVLEKTKGLMPEFVNPKYKDNSKTTLKKPTRLECMMQDFPCVLKNSSGTKSNNKSASSASSQQPQQGQQHQQRVGFTCVAAELCFSPVKNPTADGAALQKKGIPAGTVVTGEADLYASHRRILQSIGCQVEQAKKETFRGNTVVPGPAIVLKPNFCCTLREYQEKFPNPAKIQISARSTLVVRGSGVVIESLNLDGCMIVDCDDGMSLTVSSDREVVNQGWIRVREEDSDNEIVQMRGYRILHLEQDLVEVDQSNCVIL